MQSTAAAAMMVAAVAFAPACSQGRAVSDGEPRIRLNATSSGWRTVDVERLPAAELPPVLGDTAVSDGVLRFTPQFPFDPGQRYDVVFDPSSLPSTRTGTEASLTRLSTTVEMPAPPRAPSTRVVEVYPTAPEVPENHLRLYIVFSAPMSLSGGSANIHLIDDRGRAVPDPFLPLDVALWNEDRTRYTVLYDPGRVKRGIRPNEELGRALVAGRTYTLVVDENWRDAFGQPLVSGFRREFRVGPPQERAIDPAEWQLELPAPGTRDQLAVTFPIPLDYGLLHRALIVVAKNGQPVGGAIRVERAETRWVFRPHAAWQPGEYQLVASSALEDVAGNRIGRPFEVAPSVGQTLSHATGARLPFVISPSAASQ